MKRDLWHIGCVVDEAGSGSGPLAVFDIAVISLSFLLPE
jgi:hypothetical protein